jgi:hypothetical protein
VQNGLDIGTVNHPPVSRDEFVRAVTTINNYLAAEVIPAETDGYPERLDVTATNAEVRAEASKAQAAELDEASLAGIEDLD